MRIHKDVYITLDWQEQGPMDTNGRRPQWKGREVSTRNYPSKLSCHNPECKDGGFDIGDKIEALLASEEPFEQNSLVCNNAVNPDRTKRCTHTISYSISCIYPHGNEGPRTNVTDFNVG